MSIIHRIFARQRAEAPAAPMLPPKAALVVLTRKLDDAIAASEQAYAESVNAARTIGARHQEALTAAGIWRDKARQADARSKSIVRLGSTDKAAALAVDASRRAIQAEMEAARLAPQVTDGEAQIAAIRADLEKLHRTREDLRDQQASLGARSSLAAAESLVAAALADMSIENPASEMNRIIGAIRTEEAVAAGHSELARLASPDKAFDDAYASPMAEHGEVR